MRADPKTDKPVLPEETESLVRVLQRETQTGFQDAAMAGGLELFVTHEVERAQSSPSWNKVLALFRNYSRLSIAQRKRAIENALRTLHLQDEPAKLGDTKRRNDVSRFSAPDTPVQFVKGIGQRRAEALGKLGVRTARDLLVHFPQRYEDRTHIKQISQLREGENESICGVIAASGKTRRVRGMSITSFLLADTTGRLTLTWFNQPYRETQFERGQRLFAYGTVRRHMGALNMVNPETELLDVRTNNDRGSDPDAEMGGGSDTLQVGRMVPVYPLSSGLYQSALRRGMFEALRKFLPSIDDPLPEDLRKRQGLVPLHEALQQIHFPDSFAALERARRRLVFEELLLLQIGLALRKRGITCEPVGTPLPLTDAQCRTFAGTMPFRFTKAQRRVMNQLRNDLASQRPMNRLIHGDVGSGKTVVAALAIFAATENSQQAALMVPTELLAEQHTRVMSELLRPLGLAPTLLTGSLSEGERRRALSDIREGRAQFAVGTHALIMTDVEFHRLAVVIVDEQHRFGVVQRAALAEKGYHPHTLVMTATPIPRTLALTVYGDLDVSVIDELPPGRKPVETTWIRSNRRDRAYRFVRQEINQGRQAYVVCPLVEESERYEDVQAATDTFHRLRSVVFPDLRVGLIYGRMPSSEREEVMARFRKGEIDVLTATTVIEVGVDVPNASVMLIEDADRFGLAQLHQLRGRVGRSKHQAYCLLIADARTEEAQSRLASMKETTDGFLIAERDLELRGPGEFFGTRQHGMPRLRLANVIQDVDILQLAREEAFALVQEQTAWNDPSLKLLHQAVEALYGNRMMRLPA